VTDDLILRDLGLILLAAAGTALVGRRFKVPGIVAYIVAGLLLGPATHLLDMHAGDHGSGVALISEVGIALLLFLVGLELSFSTVKAVGAVAVAGGLSQTTLSGLAGAGLALLLGYPMPTAIFIGVALAFSSTVIVVKLLEQRGDLRETYGQVTLGILLVQDLVVIIVLTALAGLAGAGTGAAGAATDGVVRDLAAAFGGMILLVAVSVVAAGRVLPGPFRWIARSPEAILVWSLALCFAMIVAAKTLSLSLELGAFLAGVSLAQLPYNQDLRRRVAPLVDFFLAVFFVSLGASMDVAEALSAWPAAVALIAFVLIGKPVILLAVVPRLGFGERTAALTGITLGQTSEFSFILAGLGLSAGIIGPDVLALISLVGLGTMGISSALILRSRAVYERLSAAGWLRVFGAPLEGPADQARGHGHHGPADDLDDHVIVVGMNTMGRHIVDGLHARGVATLAIDTDPAKLAAVKGATLLGNVDAIDVLESAGIRRARLVVSALQIESANNLLAYRCRAFGVPSAIHAFDRSVVDDLRRIGATHLLESKTEGTRRLSEALHAEGVYG
jgi:Kef-type K+ transport system membrane component KefB